MFPEEQIMGRISVLDCTLRDGAYIVDSDFGEPAIYGIIDHLKNAGIDVIECGWLKDKDRVSGSTFFHTPDDLIPYISTHATEKNSEPIYTVMIDWDRYDLSNLPVHDGRSVDAVRVVFPHGKHKEGIAVASQIADKGYLIFLQIANTLAYTDDELVSLSEEVNRLHPVAVSIVDTFGAMYEEDLERISDVLDWHLAPDIRLGFHSHNNQQLSFALSIAFIKFFADKPRDILIDSSLCGMGRGAGNATTELIVSYLNKKCGCHYDIDAILDAVDIYMGYYLEHFRWGYSVPYLIAGMNCCHVNNIAYLLNNHRTNTRDMRYIIESLSAAERLKYDYSLLEQKYVDIVNRKVDDSLEKTELQNALAGRDIILVAPGKSSLAEQKRILSLTRSENAVVIGVNAILPEYEYNYVFFVNPARYEYASNTFKDTFTNVKKILLSNIRSTPGPNELIIAYEHAVKQGWPHFDNAVICALRLLDWLEITHVKLVGFDGFATRYNESYADPYLPSLNPDNKWDKLNEEILEMFLDFKSKALYCRNIEFITDSYFNR